MTVDVGFRPYQYQAKYRIRPLGRAIGLALVGLGLGAASVTLSAQEYRTQQVARQDFDIPAGDLAPALRALASQAGVLLTFTEAQVAGKHTAGVSGSHSPWQALALLLAGSGLAPERLANGAYILRPATNDDSLELRAVEIGASRQARAADLPESYAGGQVARGGRLGMLGNLDIMEAPFSQTSYTSELIENQQAKTIGDVIQNDPSVRLSSPASGYYQFLQIRGYQLQGNDISINGLYDLAPTLAETPVEFAERVEVLRGPNALLSGMSPGGAVGGAVNIQTKRAGDAPLSRLTLSLDSDSLWKGHVDVGRRFGESRWGVRFNGSQTGGETYIDGQKRQGNNFALALDYRGERTRMALDVMRLDQKIRNGAPFFVNMSGLSKVLSPPDGSTNIMPGADAHHVAETAIFSGEFDLTGNLTAYAKLGYKDYDYDGILGHTVFGMTPDGSGSLMGMEWRQEETAKVAETGLNANFATGPIWHTLVVSSSYTDREVRSAFNRDTSWTTNIYNPQQSLVYPAAPGKPLGGSDNTLRSLALADTLRLVDDRLLVTLGVRRQNVKVESLGSTGVRTAPPYDEHAWTPMTGIVFRLHGGLSIYANYIQGLSQGATVGASYLNAGEVFPPYKTKQLEVGVKLETGGFTNTLGAFQIKRPSTLVDYSTQPSPSLRLNGEQRNRGIEWSVFGEVTPGVRVLGGATYIQGRLTRTQNGLQDGNDAPGVTPFAVNLGGEWDLPAIAGLTLSARLIHSSAQYLDADNKLKVPDWRRVDIGARYATRLGGRPVVLRAGVDNLLDKTYWVGGASIATVGAPRTFGLSATVDF
ncbi:TonB-dependent receptor [Stutzerimonas kirkiae]|uniref:TonB-dependent receptor n=1 Tax=Stutzerimonas kirkiae TaxID=2211392 RepID=UPI0010384BE9|nr:TonB-dependent receptor [Stutzerimonas kirkiae]TBV07514.1 TonB-dependent siderophore receptor [Stutzerimonas kirkiae]